MYLENTEAVLINGTASTSALVDSQRHHRSASLHAIPSCDDDGKSDFDTAKCGRHSNHAYLKKWARCLGH